jgi:D-alanyl-D-alanine carboxypeptidase/D-alanyl-D-alanine-endopeptidase (penicillin-binding protein 4)
MKNGSGLNDANRFSARQTTRLLAETWRRFPVAAEYLASLPVAGKDGTVRWRLDGPETAGRVRAKTGTLDGVGSLSGYAESAGGERLAFAILVNDAPGQGAAVGLAIDAVATAVVTGGAGRAATAAAPAGPAVPGGEAGVAGTAEALDAAALTYLAMGWARDRRNLRFLRTALSGETAPELRLAVAEALYRSNPDADTARRGLLEATAPPIPLPPLLRLLPLARPGDPPPVVAALGDLAGEGSGEALARLLALAAAEPPEPLRAALASVLGEVADAAPAELRLALLAAAPPAREAAAALLGDRLPPAPPRPAPATIGPAAVRPDR